MTLQLAIDVREVGAAMDEGLRQILDGVLPEA
jgi:hypothetical protein